MPIGLAPDEHVRTMVLHACAIDIMVVPSVLEKDIATREYFRAGHSLPQKLVQPTFLLKTH